MSWKDVDLEKYVVAAAPYGGPIALIRDSKKIVYLKEGNLPVMQIYTSSGKLIHKFEWREGKIAGMGWTLQTNLVCILEEGKVILYNVYGHQISSFSLGEEVKTDHLVECQMWGNGFVARTVNVHLIGVFDVESDEPRIFTLADPELQLPPTSWTVFPPNPNNPETPPTVLLATEQGTILAVSISAVHDQLLSNGPFTKMSMSPSGKVLACFSRSGNLWVTLSDFEKSLTDFSTNSQDPLQLAWCGNDSVLMYWDKGLLMVGPAGDWIKYSYDDPIVLVPEIDGVRIFSNERCEFVHRVPEVHVHIFQIGSTAPSAMLYDALEHYQKKSPKADENVRSIKNELSNAVDECIEAAGHEYSHKTQRTLLKAAAFGKAFLDHYPAEKFVNMCKTLRVLNAIRNFEVGIPITYNQYQRLTPDGLIKRLMSMRLHLLAFYISKHLGHPVQRVLVGWACEKVRFSTGTPDAQLSQQIFQMLKDSPGISYARIASVAYQVGKKELATNLLDYEPRAADQVPLLLRMEKDDVALSKAVESGDTDLVYLVLLSMIQTKSPKEFLDIVRQRPAALDLLLSYCKQQDHELLKKMYFHMDQPHLKASVLIRDAYAEDKFEKLLAGLQQALVLYQSSKEHAFHAKTTEEQIRFLLAQRDLEMAIGKPFIGCSVSETILKLLSMGEMKRVNKIRSDYKVPDKRFWWLRLKALSQVEPVQDRLAQLKAFAGEKKSPIGYEPFAEVAIASCLPGAYEPAIQYIQKIADPASRAEYFVRISEWKAAADTAYKAKNVEQLESIYNRCNTPDKSYIEQLLQQLSR